MKKHSSLFAAFVLLCSLYVFSSVSCAADTSDVVVSLQIDNPIMEVNGVEAEIDAGLGTRPIVADDRTLVPIRAIIEAFGGVVGWDEGTQTVLLTLDDDTIKLVIDSTTAYLNGSAATLDVAPVVINDRTMLPIRFVAEGFHLGVAWDADTQTVSIIRNSFDTQEYNNLMQVLPAYAGSPYVQINNNMPFFQEYEIISGSFEYYSALDNLGRCDVCMASVSAELMPTEDRESLNSVTPTGWHNAVYDSVEGGYIYNRCHLIAYQLTGENDNERNLITGTRYLNVEGMLPFENMVDAYIEQTANHVMYRVTPVFRGNNLVADGVLLEAYSVEDSGQGISFCVFCYNVQPGIKIDYTTGDTAYENSGETGQKPDSSAGSSGAADYSAVYRTPTGTRYHLDPDCGGENSFEVTLEEATEAGLTPCQKCAV